MKNLILVFVFLTGIFLSGCENNEILLSEKKLKEKISGTWKIVAPRPSADFVETWVFESGANTVSSSRANSPNMNANGGYSIDAKFSKAYISLSGFTFTGRLHSGFTAADLNRKWTLVELSEDVLYISATDDGGAIRSIEFTKQ